MSDEPTQPPTVYDFLPDWTPPEGAATKEELDAAIDGILDLRIFPWDDDATIARKQSALTGRPPATPADAILVGDRMRFSFAFLFASDFGGLTVDRECRSIWCQVDSITLEADGSKSLAVKPAVQSREQAHLAQFLASAEALGIDLVGVTYHGKPMKAPL